MNNPVALVLFGQAISVFKGVYHINFIYRLMSRQISRNASEIINLFTTAVQEAQL